MLERVNHCHLDVCRISGCKSVNGHFACEQAEKRNFCILNKQIQLFILSNEAVMEITTWCLGIGS